MRSNTATAVRIPVHTYDRILKEKFAFREREMFVVSLLRRVLRSHRHRHPIVTLNI